MNVESKEASADHSCSNHAHNSPYLENLSTKSDSAIRELTPPYWSLSPCVTPNISSVRISGASIPLSPQSRPCAHDESLSSCSSSSNTPKLQSQNYSKPKVYGISHHSMDALMYSQHPSVSQLPIQQKAPPYYQQSMSGYFSMQTDVNSISYALNPSTTGYLPPLNTNTAYNSCYYHVHPEHQYSHAMLPENSHALSMEKINYTETNLSQSTLYHPIHYNEYQTPNFNNGHVKLEERKENIMASNLYTKRLNRYSTNNLFSIRDAYGNIKDIDNKAAGINISSNGHINITNRNTHKGIKSNEVNVKSTVKPNHFPCEYPNCTKTFSRPYNLKSHKRTHTKERPYECDFKPCRWKFARPHDLRRHQLQHTGQKPHGCKYCHRRFARSDALKRHLKVDISCAQALRNDD